MVLPVADAITQVADNFTKHVEDLIQKIDSGLAKLVSFPYTIGFSPREEVSVLEDIATKYQAAGYNVKLVKATVTDTQPNGYILHIRHGNPYSDTGTHILFKC